MSTSVRVFARFRPINKREKAEAKSIKGEQIPFTVTGACVRGQGPENFDVTLDDVLWMDTTQDRAFDRVAMPICLEVLKGFNGTVFAYGQTGSGKTYTLFGDDVPKPEPDSYGLIPRSAQFLFDEIGRSTSFQEASVEVSFVEIYMEKLLDLLNPGQRLKLWDSIDGIFCEGLSYRPVQSPEEVLELIEYSKGNRKTAFTKMNAQSSRSHCVMTFHVKSMTTDGIQRQSKLNFGDLAGSEVVKKTGASGESLEQAKFINKSLSNLGLCIKLLITGREHIPYRDSKLTFILKDSLGGNCKTTLLC